MELTEVLQEKGNIYTLKVSEEKKSGPDVLKVLLTAKYCNIRIPNLNRRVPTLDAPAEPLELKKVKTQESQVDETCTYCFGNAIARTITRWTESDILFGKSSPDMKDEIEQWIDTSKEEIEDNLRCLHMIRKIPNNVAGEQRVYARLKSALAALDKHLYTKKKAHPTKGPVFLVGDSITLADIIMICVLICGYADVLPQLLMVNYENVDSYVNHMISQSNFKEVVNYQKQTRCALTKME